MFDVLSSEAYILPFPDLCRVFSVLCIFIVIYLLDLLFACPSPLPQIDQVLLLYVMHVASPYLMGLYV